MKDKRVITIISIVIFLMLNAFLIGGIIMPTIYGHCNNHCEYEVYPKNEVYSKEEVYSKADFVVLTGIIEMPEAGGDTTTGTAHINYPTGFTKDNCVVISLLAHNPIRPDQWSTPVGQTAMSMTTGAGELRARLTVDNITIQTDKLNVNVSRNDVTFKLVLMKIS